MTDDPVRIELEVYALCHPAASDAERALAVDELLAGVAARMAVAFTHGVPVPLEGRPELTVYGRGDPGAVARLTQILDHFPVAYATTVQALVSGYRRPAALGTVRVVMNTVASDLAAGVAASDLCVAYPGPVLRYERLTPPRETYRVQLVVEAPLPERPAGESVPALLDGAFETLRAALAPADVVPERAPDASEPVGLLRRTPILRLPIIVTVEGGSTNGAARHAKKVVSDLLPERWFVRQGGPVRAGGSPDPVSRPDSPRSASPAPRR